MSNVETISKRGRKQTTVNIEPSPQFNNEALEEREQSVAIGRQVEAVMQDSAEAYRIVGQVQAFDFMRKTVDVSAIILLRQMKESKQFKMLKIHGGKTKDTSAVGMSFAALF